MNVLWICCKYLYALYALYDCTLKGGDCWYSHRINSLVYRAIIMIVDDLATTRATGPSQYKDRLSGYRDPIIKIRLPHDCLIFIIRIIIPLERRYLHRDRAQGNSSQGIDFPYLWFQIPQHLTRPSPGVVDYVTRFVWKEIQRYFDVSLKPFTIWNVIQST